MSKLFNSVKLNKPKKSLFDLSHEKKLSLNMGELVPIMLQEVVPGDYFRGSSEVMVRLAPMVAPMMHRVNAYVHYFFVPNRLVFSGWQDFITGGRLGDDATVFPKIALTGTSSTSEISFGSLWDYLGLPPISSGSVSFYNTLSVNALPFRAYQLIFNEYYRDQNLTAPISFGIGSTLESGDTARLLALRNRAWEKDYFTSALPWTQRGGETLVPGTPDYKVPSMTFSTGTQHDNDPLSVLNSGSDKLIQEQGSGYVTELDNLEGFDISINDLRRAARLQQWLERNALGGSRYIESILAHFGVRSSDRTLQRPQYLGGGKCPIVISEVLNTSATATEPQGNMAGHGIGVGNSNQFRSKFEEHGFIFGILSILPRTAYSEGLDRVFKKFDKFDYYWPEFANLGEQEVLNEEVYWRYNQPLTTNEDTWGYQSRYAEYKFQKSSVHGDFRGTMTQWHMGRIFGSFPALNEAFVTSDPTHRVFANTTTTVDKVYAQIYNNVKAIRPMPKFGTPGIHVV